MNEPFKIQLEINPAKIVEKVIAELQEDGTLVVPVYCRECVHYANIKGKMRCTAFSGDPYEMLMLGPDGYCSEGVLKEEANE